MMPATLTGGFTSAQLGLSNYGDTLLPNNVILGQFAVLDSLTNGFLRFKEQTDHPSASTGYETLYGRDGKVWFQDGAGLRVNVAGDDGLPGILTPSGDQWSATSVLLVAGRGYFNRFVVKKTLPGTLIAFVVSTFATADDSIEVALYDSTGTVIDTSGLVTGKLNTSNGVKTITLPETLLPGTYYAGMLCPTVGGTAATVFAVGLGSTMMMQIFGATAPNMLACQQAGLATLPATIVPSFATANTPVMAVRSA